MTKIKDQTSPDTRVNLDRLATYLEKLPADYAHFEMSTFIDEMDLEKAANYVVNNGSVSSCGTAACAVGHGPAAHMFFNADELTEFARGGFWATEAWTAYTRRVFGVEGDEFEWMFGDCWGRHEDDGGDNTVRGAAARIRYFLAHGVPEDFNEDMIDDYFDIVGLYAPFLTA